MNIKLCFFALAVIVFSWSANSEEVGVVLVTKNEVKAKQDNKERVLQRRSKIVKQDTISTGKNGRVNFRMTDGTLFTLGEQTKFTVKEFNFGEGIEKPNAVFELTEGVFRSITGQITKGKNPSFRLETPMGSIGIRGTDFWGGYLDEGKIDVILLSSEHPIIIKNAYGTVVIKEPGTGITIEPGKAPSIPVKWSKEKLNRAVETITID